MSNHEIAAKLGGFLFAVSAVCVLTLMMMGAHPAPVTGRAMGETLGAAYGSSRVPLPPSPHGSSIPTAA